MSLQAISDENANNQIDNLRIFMFSEFTINQHPIIVPKEVLEGKTNTKI